MRKILIVEDDRFITAIFTMFIKDLGHDLLGRATSGLQAIEMCKADKPDVVLMDIHLEGEIDGIQTSERLQREVGIPVIYISSDTSSDVIKRAVVSNSYGYLVKPINKQELGIAIDLAYYKYKVDQEQKEREKGYREFISESPTPIVLVSDGKFAYLNKASLGIFKTHYIEDIMGLAVTDFICKESIEEVEKALSEGIEDEKLLTPFCAQLKTVHGDSYWVKITGSKLVFNNKQTTQLVLNDISDEVLHAEFLNDLQDALFKDNKVAFALSSDFQLVRMNKVFVKATGSNNTKIAELIKNIDELVSSVQENFKKQILKFEMPLQFYSNNSYHCQILIKKNFKGGIDSIICIEA